MTRERAGCAARALCALVLSALVGSCNLLVGEYSIRDGLAVEETDAALEDSAIGDRLTGDRARSDRTVTGRAPGRTDAGDDDDAR